MRTWIQAVTSNFWKCVTQHYSYVFFSIHFIANRQVKHIKSIDNLWNTVNLSNDIKKTLKYVQFCSYYIRLLQVALFVTVNRLFQSHSFWAVFSRLKKSSFCQDCMMLHWKCYESFSVWLNVEIVMFNGRWVGRILYIRRSNKHLPFNNFSIDPRSQINFPT